MGIDVKDDNFGAVLNCAVRYCLGRQTYMPRLVCDFIRPLLPELSNKAIWCFQKDIKDHQSYGYSFGADFDERMWMDFYHAVEEEQKRREQLTGREFYYDRTRKK